MQYLSMYTREILTRTGYLTLSSAYTIFTPRSVEAVTGNELAHINLMIVQVALFCHSLCIFSYSVEWGVVYLWMWRNCRLSTARLSCYTNSSYKLTNEIGFFSESNQWPVTQLSGHYRSSFCLRADSGPSFSAYMVALINYWRNLKISLSSVIV